MGTFSGDMFCYCFNLVAVYKSIQNFNFNPGLILIGYVVYI